MYGSRGQDKKTCHKNSPKKSVSYPILETKKFYPTLDVRSVPNQIVFYIQKILSSEHFLLILYYQ